MKFKILLGLDDQHMLFQMKYLIALSVTYEYLNIESVLFYNGNTN